MTNTELKSKSNRLFVILDQGSWKLTTRRKIRKAHASVKSPVYMFFRCLMGFGSVSERPSSVSTEDSVPPIGTTDSKMILSEKEKQKISSQFNLVLFNDLPWHVCPVYPEELKPCHQNQTKNYIEYCLTWSTGAVEGEGFCNSVASSSVVARIRTAYLHERNEL